MQVRNTFFILISIINPKFQSNFFLQWDIKNIIYDWGIIISLPSPLPRKISASGLGNESHSCRTID